MQQYGGNPRYSQGTTYAHLFNGDGETIIQYYFFYPFNRAANRHEGDWEHINVAVTSQNPSTASIRRVEYYFHKYVTPRCSPGYDYSVTSSMHPKVFVGGYNNACGLDGHGTHGSYPTPGSWVNVNIGPVSITETVDGAGLQMHFNSCQNVIVLPALSGIDRYSSLAWVLYGGHWGYPITNPSTCSNAVTFAQIFGAFFEVFPVGQPYLYIIGWVASGLVNLTDASVLEDTKLGSLGPRFNGWDAPYWQSGSVVY
jgi:hypothetical protein